MYDLKLVYIGMQYNHLCIITKTREKIFNTQPCSSSIYYYVQTFGSQIMKEKKRKFSMKPICVIQSGNVLYVLGIIDITKYIECIKIGFPAD